jgi:hypothetical protein
VVGFSTLRLRGVYFVVFTFGLTELVHQVINTWEIKINKTATRYIFSDVSNATIYYTLLTVALITVIGSWYVSQRASAMRCARSARTRRWRAIPASTPPGSRCCACALGLGDGAGRRDAGAALSLYRRQHRLQ